MQTRRRITVWVIIALVGGIGLGTVAPASAETGSWARQFGTTGADEALGVALDEAGNAYVVGWVFGSLPDQAPAGTVDAFVRKYDAAGNELWTRQFGSWERDFVRAVATDEAGNAYVVGETHGVLPGQQSPGGYDAFVRKYDPVGNELWTRQFGGGGGEAAWGVAVDATGHAYVAGTTGAALPGQRSAGSYDAFVRKFDPAGGEVWTRQFGGSGGEGGRGVALDRSGNALVVGTTDGALPGQASSGGFDAYLRQYDSAGNPLWTQQFGTEGDDYGVAVSIDKRGGALVVGSAGRALPGQTWAGGSDAFIRSFDPAGTVRWTQQFGTATADEAWGVAIDSGGRSYVTGNTEAGGSDVFVRLHDPAGNEMSTHRYGTTETDNALALAVDGAGRPRVAGSTRDAFSGQSSAGDRDAFVMSVVM